MNNQDFLTKQIVHLETILLAIFRNNKEEENFNVIVISNMKAMIK